MQALWENCDAYINVRRIKKSTFIDKFGIIRQ